MIKGNNSEHVDRTGALSEGRIHRAGKTHDVRTYPADRQVMVRAVRGERSVISSCDKRRTLRARGSQIE